jgi:hypothetical protein
MKKRIFKQMLVVPFHDKIDSYGRKDDTCHTPYSYKSYEEVFWLLVDNVLGFCFVLALENKNNKDQYQEISLTNFKTTV